MLHAGEDDRGEMIPAPEEFVVVGMTRPSVVACAKAIVTVQCRTCCVGSRLLRGAGREQRRQGTQWLGGLFRAWGAMGMTGAKRGKLVTSLTFVLVLAPRLSSAARWALALG